MTRSRASRALAGLLVLFALASCGDTTEERAATGAMGGAVLAGPAGAAVGGLAGTATE